MHPLPMAAGRCLLRAGPPYHLAGAPDLLPVGVCSILAIRAGKKIFPLSTEKLVSWLFHRTAETSGCVVVVAGLVGTNGLVTVGLYSCWGFSSAREKHLSLSLLSPPWLSSVPRKQLRLPVVSLQALSGLLPRLPSLTSPSCL